MSSELLADLSDFLKTYLPSLIELAGGGVERNGDFFSGLVAGLLNGFQHDFDGFDVRLHRRSEAAFVADRGVVAALLQHAFERMEDFHAPAQRLGKRGRADGHDHEFLEVDVVVGVRSAVEDVHHGRGQSVGAGAAEVAIERQAVLRRRGASGRHRDGENRVRAQAGLGLGAVEFDHFLVEAALVGGIPVRQCVGDLAVHVLHGLENTFAQEARFVSVAQFDGLVLSGGGAAGDDGAADCSVYQLHFRFHGRIAARIQNFAAYDCSNIRHTALALFL